MALSAGVAAIAEQIAGGNFLDLLKVQKQRHYKVRLAALLVQAGLHADRDARERGRLVARDGGGLVGVALDHGHEHGVGGALVGFEAQARPVDEALDELVGELLIEPG